MERNIFSLLFFFIFWIKFKKIRASIFLALSVRCRKKFRIYILFKNICIKIYCSLGFPEMKIVCIYVIPIACSFFVRIVNHKNTQEMWTIHIQIEIVFLVRNKYQTHNCPAQNIYWISIMPHHKRIFIYILVFFFCFFYGTYTWIHLLSFIILSEHRRNFSRKVFYINFSHQKNATNA